MIGSKQIQNVMNDRFITKYDFLAAIGMILLYMILSVWVFQLLEEDAFICFRYVDQLFAGNGLVFNEGEKVEGFSTFLWILLLCPFKILGIPLGQAARFMGMFFGLGTAFTVVLFMKKLLKYSHVLPWMVGYWCITSTPFLWWSQAGLETALVAFEIMAFIYILSFIKKGYLWGGIFLVLGVMTRPEINGFIPFYLSGIFLWKKCNRRNLIVVVIIAGALAGFHLLRFLYYGDVLPTPVYVKVNGTFIEGLDCVKGFFTDTHIVWAIPFFFYSLLKRKYCKQLLPAFIIVCGYTFFNLYVGGDSFRPHFRFFVPCIAPFMIISAYGVFNAVDTLRRKAGNYFIPVMASIILIIFSSAIYKGIQHRVDKLPLMSLTSRSVTKWIDKLHLQFHPYFPNIEYSYKPWLGLWIQNNFPPTTVIAYDQMGQTPYFAGIEYHFIDLFGLMNKPIAKYYQERNPSSIYTFVNQIISTLPFFEKKSHSAKLVLPSIEQLDVDEKIVKLVLGQKPEIIMVYGFIAYWHPWLDLWATPAFKHNYVLKQIFGHSWESSSRSVDYGIFNTSIFFRRDINLDNLPEKKCTFKGVSHSNFYHYTNQEEVRKWLKKYYPHLLPLTY